jgi:hypothetical protein
MTKKDFKAAHASLETKLAVVQPLGPETRKVLDQVRENAVAARNASNGEPWEVGVISIRVCVDVPKFLAEQEGAVER